MSPRAACRLETLGFTEVYDHAPGKVDWLAHALPVEGNDPEPPTAGRMARDDVVTCAPPGDLAGRLAERNLRWAIVTDPGGRLIGVASREDLESAG